jgi:hypothetical protein
MNFLRLILILVVVLLLSATLATAQSLPQGPDCPHAEGCVVISKSAARSALEAGDKVKALEAEITELQKARDLDKDDKQKLAVDFAKTSGENTILKQRAVSDAAMIELLLKQTKKKRNAFISIL